jgi:hypothetical protein
MRALPTEAVVALIGVCLGLVSGRSSTRRAGLRVAGPCESCLAVSGAPEGKLGGEFVLVQEPAESVVSANVGLVGVVLGLGWV